MTLVAIVWGFGAQTLDVLNHTDAIEGIEAASANAYAQVREQDYRRSQCSCARSVARWPGSTRD